MKTYNKRIFQVEHGSFTPLVMSATGGMIRKCKKFYSRLAGMIFKKPIGICLLGRCSLFQNDNLEMLLSKDAYTSEFLSSM